MNLKKSIAALLALGLMLASPMTAAAQGGLAKLAGTARDQSGAAVPGATLTVKNEKTGEERVATADAQGGFTIASLRPSTYTVTATFGAFAPTQYTGILLQAGQDLTLDMELKPAGLTESVSVVGDAPSIDLSSARIGVNVSEREVDGPADQRPADVAAICCRRPARSTAAPGRSATSASAAAPSSRT